MTSFLTLNVKLVMMLFLTSGVCSYLVNVNGGLLSLPVFVNDTAALVWNQHSSLPVYPLFQFAIEHGRR